MPPSELIAFLRNQLGRLETLPEDFVAKNPQSALFPTTYLALKARGAKDWRTGLGLSLTHQGRSHYIEAHHIFSKALLKKAGYETSEINEIANMAFVSGETNRRLSNKPADEYLAEIKERYGAAALEAHCIPADEDLWKIDQYAVFLEYRRAALSKAVNELISNIRVEQKLLDAQSIINEGESELIEFKSSARWDYKQSKYNKDLEVVIAKTVGGFLNAVGGVLIIGVADDATVLGLESEYKTLTTRPNRDGYEQFLVGLVSKKLGKVAATAVKLEFSNVDGKEVCIVRCQASQRPVYSGDEARFYVRLGNTTQELNPREAEDYIARHWDR